VQTETDANGTGSARRSLGWRRMPILFRRVPHHRLMVRIAMLLLCAVFCTFGALGVIRYVSTYWLYRGFPAPRLGGTVVVRRDGMTRRVAVAPVSVRQITITSRALGGYPDPVDVVLPPGYADHPTRRYPVLYLLEGSPGYPSNFLTVGQVGATEAGLVAAGRMQPLILVMPAGGRSFFADDEWVDGIRPGNDWETFVATDLVRTIDARYRTIPSGSWRGLGGLSEGGYGALNIGLHHPGEFRLLESWSGYMHAFAYLGTLGHSRQLLHYNSPADTISAAGPQLRADGTYIWFYSGALDTLKPQNVAFNAELASLDIPHHFFTWPGTHNWAMWRALAPRALITASEYLGHG
jgi:S-formylglutathione hydrolase FrmB